MGGYFREFLEDEEMTELPLRMSNLTAGEVQCIKDVVKEFKLEVAEVGIVSKINFLNCMTFC